MTASDTSERGLERLICVDSYYKLAKTVEDDPVFDVKKAREKLPRFVEGHDHAIRIKAEIMVDRFHDQVLAQGKIGGERERWSSPTASSAPSSTFTPSATT